MKGVREFRDPKLAKQVSKKIKEIAPDHNVKICHVCGTHEWTITYYGLRSLLPKNVDVIAGPGCPVCVVPAKDIDEAIWIAFHEKTITTFGDMYRAPGSTMSLADAKAKGGDVRVVYSVQDAVKMALKNPKKEFVFFAIGFSTTAPTNAISILEGMPDNLSFLTSHRLIPPAMELLLGMGELKIDGFISPGHVATVTGTEPFDLFPTAYGMPTVIAGFEPLDVLFAILYVLRQVRDGKPRLENEYARYVTREGNVKAQEAIREVFDVVDGRWRGLGRIPASALKLREEFSRYDARKRYDIQVGPGQDIHPGCSCHLIMVGKINPVQCPLFQEVCTPDHPMGPCMVSREGTCQIWAKYGAREADLSRPELPPH